MEFSVDLPGSPLDFVWWAILLAVAVVSYRRSRLLSGYPIWRAVLVAALAGTFPEVWFICSLLNRERIAAEWKQRELRLARTEPSGVAAGG